MSFDEARLTDVRRAGLVKKRLFGGYKLTLKGTWYLRDRAGLHEDVRAKLSEYAEKWESGAMTKSERREGQVELVALAWERDETEMADAVADLRAKGYDPLAPEVPEEMDDELEFDPESAFGKAVLEEMRKKLGDEPPDTSDK